MNNATKIREAIRKLQEHRGNLFLIGEVTEVDQETCKVRIDEELTLSDVRLCPVVNGKKNNLIIKPKSGSKVLLADLSGGELRNCVVISFTEIEEIRLNNGENGGLILIEELTKKLNELIVWCKNHTHSGVIVNVTGQATGTPGNSGSPTSEPKNFNKEDYENDKIKS